MNKTKLLWLSVIILLVVNVGLTAFMIINKPPHPKRPPHPHGPKKQIIKKLNFNEEQIKQFDSEIDIHRNQIKELDKQIRDKKNELYQNLSKNDPTIKDSLIREINKSQYMVEQAHYDHFLKIRSICDAEQLKKFDEMCENLTDIFHAKPPMPRP